MTGRRSFVGILALSALALCASGAASASAEQRSVMCEANTETGKEQFSDAHCTNAATGNGGFKHVDIANGFSASFVAGNAKTAKETTGSQPSKLRGAIAGVETEIECATVSGEGSLTNAASSVSGTGTIAYSGCAVLKPAGKGCVVTEGSFKTNLLAVTTVGQAANNVKFSPKSGTEFTSIALSGCSIPSLNNKFPISGTVTTTSNGATLTTTEEGVTKQGTLTCAGNKAGLEGALTVSTPLGLFAFALT